MTHKCKGLLRSPKGDRLLGLLATDRNHPELEEVVRIMRKDVPVYVNLTDDEIKDRLETLIAKVPKKCPECDGTSD